MSSNSDETLHLNNLCQFKLANDANKKLIENSITWINEEAEGFEEKRKCLNCLKDIQAGIYFFRDESGEIVYVGQSGSIKQSIKTRLNQYYKSSDTGTSAFKLKAFTNKLDLNRFEYKKDKWKEFKKVYKGDNDQWHEYMAKVSIGVLEVDRNIDTHSITLYEAYCIGLFRPKYNY